MNPDLPGASDTGAGKFLFLMSLNSVLRDSVVITVTCLVVRICASLVIGFVSMRIACVVNTGFSTVFIDLLYCEARNAIWVDNVLKFREINF